MKLLVAMVVLLPLCLCAQQAGGPPAAASPPTAAAYPGLYGPTAAAVVPDSKLLRIYVQAPQGPDSGPVAGLIEQALFDSKEVVVTENENNASVILKATIYRQLPTPTAEASQRRSRSAAERRRTRMASSAASDGTVVPDAGAPVAGSNDATTDFAASTAAPTYGLTDSAPEITDLSLYRYRLDFELVNPNGDLIWISGRGREAPGFASADDAVAASLKSMLALLAQLEPHAASEPPHVPPAL